MSARPRSPLELSSAERERWLASTAAHPHLKSPFYDLGFMDAVAEARGDVLVADLSGEGGMRGFVPFQWRGRISSLTGVAEKVGGSFSDYFGLVAPPGFRIENRELLRQAGMNALRIDHLPSQLRQFDASGAKQMIGLGLDIGPTAKGYFDALAKRDPRFVGNIERGARQLERDLGPLRFEWDVADKNADLDLVVAEKSKQYIRTGATDQFRSPWRRKALFLLAARKHPQCRLVLATLHAGSTWVASHVALCRGDLLHSWFPVYNFALRRFSPGHVLLSRIIWHAPDEGIRQLDFGLGDSRYKRRYGPDEYHLQKLTLRADGMVGKIDRVHEAVAWRLGLLGIRPVT